MFTHWRMFEHCHVQRVVITEIRTQLMRCGYTCSMIVEQLDWLQWYRALCMGSPAGSLELAVKSREAPALFVVSCANETASIRVPATDFEVTYNLADPTFPDDLLSDIKARLEHRPTRWQRWRCRLFHGHERIYSPVEDWEDGRLLYCQRCELFHSYDHRYSLFLPEPPLYSILKR